MKKKLFYKIGFISLVLALGTTISTITASAKANGWVSSGENWKYIYNGKYRTGWFNDNPTGIPRDDKWYYFDENGIMKKGWVNSKGEWYYLGSNGIMCEGWIQDKGKWYYLNLNHHNGTHGNMKKNEFFTEWRGRYYFGDDGSMVADKNIKGFYFGKDGRQDKSKVNVTYKSTVDYAKNLGFETVKENYKNQYGIEESDYKLKKKSQNECSKDEILLTKVMDEVISMTTNGFCNSKNYDELNKLIKFSVPSIADEIINYMGSPTHNLSLNGKMFYGDGRQVYVYTKDLGGRFDYDKGELHIEID